MEVPKSYLTKPVSQSRNAKISANSAVSWRLLTRISQSLARIWSAENLVLDGWRQAKAVRSQFRWPETEHFFAKLWCPLFWETGASKAVTVRSTRNYSVAACAATISLPITVLQATLQYATDQCWVGLRSPPFCSSLFSQYVQARHYKSLCVNKYTAYQNIYLHRKL